MKNKLIVILCLIIACVYLFIESRGTGDFFIYSSASADLFSGKNIYTQQYHQWYHYYYSVLFAIVLFPLTYLPFNIAEFIWLVLNAFFLFRIVKIIVGWLDTSQFTTKQKQLLFVLCLVFGARFILDNFHLKQITICILYLALEGISLVSKGNKLTGALLIALAINIKILPLVLLPYLLYRSEIKASLYVIAFYVVMMFLPALIIGIDANTSLLTSWWSLVNPMTTRNIMDVDETSFHSLSTLLATLLVEHVPDTHALPIKRNIADISLSQLTYVLNITRIIFIGFSFYFFRTRPFAPANNKAHRYWEVSYLLLLVPLIFPHQQCYAFLFITPAASWVLYYLLANRHSISGVKFKMLIVGMVISYLACSLSLLLGEFEPYYEHFKIATYGTLLLIPMLAVCIPDMRKDESANTHVTNLKLA